MSSFYEQESSFSFQTEGITFVTSRLIMLNIAVFATQLVLDVPFGDVQVMNSPGGYELLQWVAFQPSGMFSGIVWTPFTYMFLHGGLMHLFGNMLMLFFFGPQVERVLGSMQFLRFYLLCGVLGVLVNFFPIVLPSWNPGIMVVGASGATLGVLVAFAMIEPDRRVFLFPIPIPVTARLLVIFIIAMNLISAVGGGTGTSVATHFGGMGVAYIYMKWRPRLMQMRWRRQGRKVPKDSPAPGSPEEEKMAEAIDNIFDFKNRKH